MKIKQISLKRFKRLKDKTFEFTDGLNIIKGNDNEVGKSTLQMAIVKALYQNPSSRGKEILELTTWGEDKLWESEIEVEENSELYTIKKNLNEGLGVLLVQGTGEAIEDKDIISRKVAEITGCPSEAFFISTACIKQDEIIKLIPDCVTKTERQHAIGEISSRLQAVISGSEGIDVPSIISKLYDKTHRKDAKGPYYQIGQLNTQIATIEREKFDMEEKVNRLVTNRRHLVQIKDELKQIDIDFIPKRGLLEKNKKILEHEGEIKRNKELYQNYERAKKLYNDLENQDEQLTKYKIFKNLDARINELKLNIDRVGRLNEQKKNLESEVENLKNKKLPAWALIISLLFFIVGVLGLFITKYSWIVLLGGIFPLFYWFYSYQDKKKQIRFVTDKVSNLISEIKGIEDKISEITKGFGFDDYKECLDVFEDYKVQLDKRKDLSNKLSGIIGEKNWLQYKQENEDLDIRLSAAQKELEKLKPFKKEPLEFQKLETEVNTLEESKSNLGKERGALEKFFDLTDADPDQLTNITEQLEWLQKEKEFWEKRNRIFDITQQMLEEAHKETLLRATDIVKRDLGNYIFLITGGRYKDVEIDEKDLSIYAFSSEKQDRINITELSRATQDQFYICARLALIKLITNGKNPPLLLDDPFVNFHEKRLKRMISFLQELSNKHQMLLFTCSDIYDKYGTVIQIDI